MNQIANQRRPSNKDERCKKHPDNPPSPGVCSLCLNEKLTQVTSATASGSRTKLQAAAAAEGSCSVSSVSSYRSSCSSSSCASPSTKEDIKGTSGASIFLLKGKPGFAKSKSMASAVPRTIVRAERVVEKRKKPGFWSKLLHPNRKRSLGKTDHLFHSRTLVIR